MFGTRPEAIKLAPVVRELRACDGFEVAVAVTAQHREMLDQALEVFGIRPDFDLDVMQRNQSLFDVTTRALVGLREVIRKFQPNCLVVQGDTTTTFAAALAAFYCQVPVAHVEAGLRTHRRYSPFPEEMNRRLTSVLAELHFAPTQLARQHLLAENVDARDILVTGNTAIDALLWVLKHKSVDLAARLGPALAATMKRQFILVTVHRRENFGEPLRQVLSALREIAARYPRVGIILPVHPNPNVKPAVEAALGEVPNVHLIEPLDYVTFVHAMNRAHLVLTDSGGVQEEAPSLGKPILVMRESTERPEGVEAGTALLVGTDRQTIVEETSRLLDIPAHYQQMANATNPYGDGTAAARIVQALAERLSQPA